MGFGVLLDVQLILNRSMFVEPSGAPQFMSGIPQWCSVCKHDFRALGTRWSWIEVGSGEWERILRLNANVELEAIFGFDPSRDDLGKVHRFAHGLTAIFEQWCMGSVCHRDLDSISQRHLVWGGVESAVSTEGTVRI